MGEAGDGLTIPPTAVEMARVAEGDPTFTPLEDATPLAQAVQVEEPEAMQIVPGELEEEARDDYGSPLATTLPWRALEIVLGLAALGLAIASVSAWRARRQ